MILLTKPGCKKCEKLLRDFPILKERCRVLSIESVDGLVELAYYELFAIAEKILPILIDKGRIYEGYIKIKKKIKE